MGLTRKGCGRFGKMEEDVLLQAFQESVSVRRGLI